jgi:anti-sigma B factor antagonist
MDRNAAGDWTTVRLTGEIDLVTVEPFREQVEGLLAGGECLLRFDLSDVTFLDSQGLALLALAHRGAKAAGGRIQVVGASGTLRRLLEFSGMAWLLIPETPNGSVA